MRLLLFIAFEWKRDALLQKYISIKRMWRIHRKKNNVCITILTCVCLGNLLLYIAFTNLRAEYIKIKHHSDGRIQTKLNVKETEDGEEHERYIVNEPFKCNQRNVDLIIVVCSSLDHFKQRKAIRETWGNSAENESVKLVFLVGTWLQSRFSKINITFSKEISTYKDIVQGDFIDSYRNLTLKSIYMLHWVKTYCSHANFLLKTDDDMYINIPNLFKALNKQILTKFLMGNLISGAKPVQDKSSKWYTPKNTFPEVYYPPYLSGTSYVISISVLSELYNATKSSKYFWLEDVFITGVCAKAAGIFHIHRNDMTFNTPEPFGCSLKSLISGHKIKWQNMYSVYQAVINDDRIVCDKSK
ncbi:beta-1,3-galactosyltransferase 1-like isoform X1 [Mytilus californianus]|uniref:beta-1,3-galactosyltransferase 1-like isoform X1 n=2 Tax=Mytilus californianus TaxID=6549 RepID=UPI0022485401|nr:beta-1,3-galactosyltransferase 1-like isoform X1 [Mytilus californianus]